MVWISSYKLQSARFKLEPHHCLFFMAGGQVCCQCSGTGCLCWAAGIFLFPLLAQLAAAARAIYRWRLFWRGHKLNKWVYWKGPVVPARCALLAFFFFSKAVELLSATGVIYGQSLFWQCYNLNKSGFCCFNTVQGVQLSLPGCWGIFCFCPWKKWQVKTVTVPFLGSGMTGNCWEHWALAVQVWQKELWVLLPAVHKLLPDCIFRAGSIL